MKKRAAKDNRLTHEREERGPWAAFSFRLKTVRLFPARPARPLIRTIAALLLVFVARCNESEQASTADDLGRSVAVPRRVGRVVTLAPNLTEIVFAIGAGDRIVATDDFSNMPEAALALPKVGGLQPDIEKIVSLRPDLVLASTSGNHPNLAAALAAAKVPLFVVKTDRLQQIPQAMRRVGEILNAPGASAAAARVEQETATQRRQRRHAPRVLFMVWADPLYVAGAETFSGDLIEWTGARNAVSSRGWPQYPLEELARSAPDLLLYPDRSVPPGAAERLIATVANLDRKVRVVAVDEDRFTRPGPRVGQAAKDLNQILDGWEKERQR